VPALRLAELELRETTARLGRIVIRDGGLEALAKRRRLRELAAKPAKQADGVRAGRDHGCILAARLSCVDPGPHRLVA
jgi:hypothetical protein